MGWCAKAVVVVAALVGVPARGMVIAEFYASGGKSGALYERDYVVLKNTTAGAVDLSGWAFQHWKVGVGWIALPLPASLLAPGGTYLIRLYYDQGAAEGALLPGVAFAAPDDSAWNLSTSNGEALALTRTTAVLTGCGSTELVDLVGFNPGAPCSEGGTIAPTTSVSRAAQRLAGGTQDTGDNAADFALVPPLSSVTTDGGLPASDGGADAGPLQSMDGGVVSLDGGADAGPPQSMDGGVVSLDGGVDAGGPDAGGGAGPGSDAGVLPPDGGAEAPASPRDLAVGCGCGHAAGGPGSLFGLGLLAGLRRRRARSIRS